MTQWDNKFEEALRRHLPHLDDDEELEADMRLRDLGLDSVAMVELLSTVESLYNVRFADDALTPETFETPATLWQTLSASRS